MTTSTAIAAMIGSEDMLVRIESTAAVRRRFTELAGAVKAECLSFNVGAPSTLDGDSHSSHIDHQVLKRGVLIRVIYQDSFRNDWRSLAHAQRLSSLGGEVRSAPRLPTQMVIYDREVALLPAGTGDDPRTGALEVHSPAVVAVLCGFFEQIWSAAHAVSTPTPVDHHGLDPVERELLKLLSDGHTDRSAGRKLGLSARTVQRMMADLTGRLRAESRFQAGVSAVRLGWL